MKCVNSEKIVNVIFHNAFHKKIVKNLNDKEYDLFMCIIARMRDCQDRDVVFTIKELTSSMRSETQRRARTISLVESLWDKVSAVNYLFVEDAGEKDIHVSLFTKAVIDKTADTVTFALNKDLLYLLNDLSKDFTCFRESEFLKTENIYGKRLFVLLSKFRSTGSRKDSVQGLRANLDCPASYNQQKFHSRVLLPAMKSVEEFFPGLKLRKITQKNKVVSYEIVFKKRPPIQKSQGKIKNHLPEERKEIKELTNDTKQLDYIRSYEKQQKWRSMPSSSFMSLLERIGIKTLVNDDYFERHDTALAKIEKNYITKVVNQPNHRLWNDMTFLASLIYVITKEEQIAPWTLESAHAMVSKGNNVYIKSSVYEALSERCAMKLHLFASEGIFKEID